MIRHIGFLMHWDLSGKDVMTGIVRIPTYRPDIFREIDLIEEVARIYGFDDIPADESLYGSFRYDHPDPEQYIDTIRSFRLWISSDIC